MRKTLTGTDKSVILLMTIGEDRAAEVFKHLSQREVQILSAAMANVRQISNKQLTEVLAEFEQEAEQFAALNVNANEYLRSVLVKALGEERAASLLEDILETRDTASGIDFGCTSPRHPKASRASAPFCGKTGACPAWRSAKPASVA